MNVSLAVALPGRQEVVALVLPDGATVRDALAAARAREAWPQLEWSRVTFGVWSKACGEDRVLREGDRVEVYRPLAADPKDQRRARLKASPRSRSGP